MSEAAAHLSATILPEGMGPTDLWIVDGRITFAPQPDARELAPAGGFVVAGLVDAHTHLHFVGDPSAPRGRAVVDASRRLHLRAGTLLLRDLGATDDAVLGLADDDGLPVVHAAGRCLLAEPRAPFFVTAARELADAAAAQAKAGARWVKVFADWPGWPGRQEEPNFSAHDQLTYPTETLAQAVDAAHAAGARVAIHAFGREAAAAGIAAGVDSIEHGWGLDEALLDAMARQRIAWTPMFGIAAPMLRGAEQSRDDRQVAWIRDTLVRMNTLLPAANARGVTILAGTDWFPSVTLVDEVTALHRHGLAPAVALAAASSAARAFLGAPGLVESAPADLVLFRDDPRDDLRRLATPARIVLRGRVVGAEH